MYKCFTEKGKANLPEEEELVRFEKNGIRPIIFIDTNICLHIARFIDYKKNAKNIDINKILELKKYIDKFNIELSPFLSLLELSYKNGKLDEDKL